MGNGAGWPPKQAVQCPGQEWAWEVVLDAKGLLYPFSCFSNTGSLQTLVTAGQALAPVAVAS